MALTKSTCYEKSEKVAANAFLGSVGRHKGIVRRLPNSSVVVAVVGCQSIFPMRVLAVSN